MGTPLPYLNNLHDKIKGNRFMSKVVSADEIKKQLFDYTPDKAGEFHSASAKLADKLFYEEIKKDRYKQVIFLNGGTASGKTEFLSTHLNHRKGIIFDATLSTELGADIKFKRVLKLRKIPVVYAVIPDDINRAFIAFLNRDRKFGDTHFYQTHSGSRKTLLWIANKYSQVQIHIIESSYTQKQEMAFTRIEFDSRNELIKYLNNIQMSESDIISLIQSKL